MAKQKKKTCRRNPQRTQGTAFEGCAMGFCLPDTPGNRELVEILTGKRADQFANEDTQKQGKKITPIGGNR